MVEKIAKSIIRIRKAAAWLYVLGKPLIPYVLTVTMLSTGLSLASVGVAIVSKSFVDTAVSGDREGLMHYAILFILLIITLIGLNAVISMTSAWIGEKVSNTIREKLFTHITVADWLKISAYHSRDLLTRLTSDAATVTGCYLDLLPGIISLFVQLAAAFTALYIMSPMLALLGLLLGPAALLFSRFFAYRLGRLHRVIQETESKYRSFMAETVQNLLVMKSFELEKFCVERMRLLQSERLDFVLKKNKLSLTMSSIISLGYWSGYFLAFFWGGLGLVAGTITFGTMTAFLQLIGQIQSPFMDLARSFPQIISVMVSAERLMEIENIPSEINEDSIVECLEAGIVFENVSYYYEDDKHVIKNATLKVNPGEIVGIVGPSGEGKTTLIHLLLAIMKPVKGEVYFITGDGVRINADSSSRKLISYVPQGNTLYSGTVKENILAGNTDAADDEIMKAADNACALNFIKEFPEAFNTVIGEKGHGISEGQAQRIAIARALLRKSPILVLDEATSALDMETELKVLQTIRNMNSPRMTCIMVTHRKSALNICSRIFKVEDGVLKETEYNNFGRENRQQETGHLISHVV